MYEIYAYYDYFRRGLAADLQTSDFTAAEAEADLQLFEGHYVTIKNLITGASVEASPDEYFAAAEAGETLARKYCQVL